MNKLNVRSLSIGPRFSNLAKIKTIWIVRHWVAGSTPHNRGT